MSEEWYLTTEDRRLLAMYRRRQDEAERRMALLHYDSDEYREERRKLDAATKDIQGVYGSAINRTEGQRK